MFDRDLQEFQEYDAQLFEDSPFAPAARRPHSETSRVADESFATFESPFQAEDALQRESFSFETEAGVCAVHASREAEGEEEISTSEFEAELESLTGADEYERAIDEAEQLDPYAGIRFAMSPQHANLTADEVTVVLGGLPASLALHQLVNSPAMQQATVASILGPGARRSVQVHGSDVSIPAYLRLVSRLCGEVAEQSETPPAKPKVSIAHPALPRQQGRSSGAKALAGAVSPPGPPPHEVASRPLGVDLYSKNRIDAAGFRNLKDHGKTFAIVKTSQGTTTYNTGQYSFDNYYRWTREAGMIRGSFHFFSNPRVKDNVFGGSVEDQAKAVLSLVSRLAPGDLAPALDLEDEPKNQDGYNLDSSKGGRYPLDEGLRIESKDHGYHYRTSSRGVDDLLQDMQEFLDRIETALGRAPMIYTSNTWTDDMGNPQKMSQYPLWAVWHGWRLANVSVGAWGKSWDLIQYAEQSDTTRWRGRLPYEEPGINIPGIDFDAYQWTIYGLRGLADIGRPSIAVNGNGCYIAQTDVDGSLRLLSGTPWIHNRLTSLSSQGDLISDPALLASSTDLFLYYRNGNHLIEATAKRSDLANWRTAQIEDLQSPIHDPRAVTNGSKRHVVYWGAGDDWHLLSWDNGWSGSGDILTLAGIKTSATHGQSTGQPMVYINRGTVHVAGRAGADGHLYDVWFEGSSWRHEDLTALLMTLVPKLPKATYSATYSPCAYETSSGMSIVFRAVRGSLWVMDRANNTATNITDATQATPAAGHPTCFVLNNEPHIVYRGSDKIVYDLWLQRGSWQVQKVWTEKTAADPVATNNGAVGLVAIRAMDGVIQFARFDGKAWNRTPIMDQCYV